MSDFLVIAGLGVAWFGLFRWILPLLGVPTCLSGCCGTPGSEEDADVCPVHVDDGGGKPIGVRDTSSFSEISTLFCDANQKPATVIRASSV